MADPTPTYERHKAHGSYGSTVFQNGPIFWIEICDVCHYVTATCLHRVNKWEQVRPPDPLNRKDDGKELICQTCGINGT